jgi:cell division protein FtsL
MPAASASTRSRRASSARRPTTAKTAPRAARVRWDRLGRVAMLGVMMALLYLYLSAGVRVFSTWHEAHRNSALLSQLERQNKQLRAEHASLGRHSTVVREARQLGMDKPGEQPYVVQGLPNN